ncbi:MAG TPA: hypothetical protein VFL90_13530 [Methylomirabilota bacterium]|nr:hypothetical protein [Methylomirabilota bacterium]
MSPGGHLVTTLAVCAAAAAATESAPLVLGLAAGGFCIDVDHAVDYVVVERQRDLRPGAFLRYYLEGRVRRTVLALHSWELFTVLVALAWSTANPWLLGYVGGGLMHLALDLAFNGEYTPHSIVLFYSFAYRAYHRFDAGRLLGGDTARSVARDFWRAFFGAAEAAPSVLDSPATHASARRRG